MNKMRSNLFVTFVLVIACFYFTGCVKQDQLGSEMNKIHLTNKLIGDKTWTLDYLMNGDTLSRSYVSSNAYYISFYNDSLCKDFDGIAGKYKVYIQNDSLLLNVQGNTLRGNSVFSNYYIEKVGDNSLFLSFRSNESSKVTLIFKYKK